MSNRMSVVPEADDGGLDIDPFYILTPSSLAEEHDLVLKQDDTFAVFDRFGDFRAAGQAKDGLYHDGTRYLSRLALRIGRQRPLLLSSAAREDNSLHRGGADQCGRRSGRRGGRPARHASHLPRAAPP